MRKPLVYTLVAYECVRHHLRPERINRRINDALEKLPDNLETQPCRGNILCERQRVRHKAGCIGKIPSFDAYARELGSID